MATQQIRKIEIQGFRAFGQQTQTLELTGPLSAVWGPNSQGKTSLAEAFEFLLTGQIARRTLMASSQDEFAGALRNAHMPSAAEVYVEAEITDTCGQARTVRRKLMTDYGKREDCRTTLSIDGKPASEAELVALGIVLSQPPLRAPVLAQHTLGYLFSARPQDRATYFKALLEVTDLEAFRNAVAALEASLNAKEAETLAKLRNAATIPEAAKPLSRLEPKPPLAEIAEALSATLGAVIAAAGDVPPAALTARVGKLEEILAEKRAKAFPVKGFDKTSVPVLKSLTTRQVENLKTYVDERAKVEEKTRKLTALFKEALALPVVADAKAAINCPLCDTAGALATERIAVIRQRVAATESFRMTEANAKTVLAQLQGSLDPLEIQINECLPRFIVYPSSARRKRGFRVSRIRTLLGPEAQALTEPWLAALRHLVRARRALLAHVHPLKDDVARYAADPATLPDPAELEQRLNACAQVFGALETALAAYNSPEKALADRLTAVVDAESKTSGWQDLIDLARDPAGLREALVDRAAREAVLRELTQALKQIDKGNAKVLDDKFDDLSADVLKWWDLLRPEELSFFSEVKLRSGARRTIDFKAGLAAQADRSDLKLRDAIAVFSQSQLHCLGLALFLARAVHENSGFIVLDDPILSSDEDYRAFFVTSVLQEITELGLQIVILTQDQKTWKELGERYLHAGIRMFQITLEDPRQGTAVRNTADDLSARLAKIDTLVRGAANPDIRKQACQELREATERFCKLMLVRYRWANKQPAASITDYNNKNLSDLGPRVEALVVNDGSHPGKLRAIRDNLNPANHDDGIPSQGELKVSLGDLKKLKKDYLG